MQLKLLVGLSRKSCSENVTLQRRGKENRPWAIRFKCKGGGRGARIKMTAETYGGRVYTMVKKQQGGTCDWSGDKGRITGAEVRGDRNQIL